MQNQPRGYHHHVVGPIHEIVLTDPEPGILQRALAHEYDECHASRIVIDLSGIDGITVEILDEVTVPADSRRTMVRLTSGASLVPISELVDS